MNQSPRSRIIGATVDLIAERGLAGVTMSAIAETAGVARQTLYNHFRDLDAIVIAALEQHVEAVIGQLRGLLDATSSAGAGVQQLVRNSLAHARHGHDTGLSASGLSAAAQVQMARHLVAYREVIADVIRAGVDEGVFRRNLDPAAASVVVHRMLESSAELAEMSGAPSAAAELLIDMITGSLAATGRQARSGRGMIRAE